MRPFFLLVLLAAVATGCAPAEERYCQSVGTPPSQLAQCKAYYFEQQNLFNADRVVCSADADQVYPPTLYTGWSTALVRNYGYGGFSHVEQVEVPPDYQRNAQVDALRGRIIEPCMQAYGWNSGVTWQAGRHAIGKSKVAAPLPWHTH